MAISLKRSTPRVLFVVFLLNLILFDSTTAIAAEKRWTVNTALGFYSDYMFRGQDLYDGTSIQPSLAFAYDFRELGNVRASTWMHLPGESDEPPEKFSELDGTLAYDYTVFDIATLSVGYILYSFPSGEGRLNGNTTSEFFGKIALDLPLKPSLTIFDDIDEGEYQYYALNFSHDFKNEFFGDDLHLKPYTTFGFASNADDNPSIYEDDGLEHVDVGISTDIALGQFLVLTPDFHFTFKVDDSTDNELWVGMKFALGV